jgi:hypothetical protein
MIQIGLIQWKTIQRALTVFDHSLWRYEVEGYSEVLCNTISIIGRCDSSVTTDCFVFKDR